MALTQAQIKAYAKGDIIRFLAEQYFVQDKKGLHRIELEQWQIDYLFKPLFYDRDANGRRKYDIALIGIPKKNGKSTINAGTGFYMMFCDEPKGEIIIAANDKDQASMIVYDKIREAVKLNADFRTGTSIYKTFMQVKSTGTTVKAIANQFESAAGLNPNFTSFDELWGFKTRKFYDELTAVPTRANPLIVITTYAGFEQEGLLWELYSDGMAGDDIIKVPDKEVYIKRGLNDPRMFMLWSHENLSRWVTKEYLTGQRRRMPPSVYARLHENRWVASIGEVITEADLARITDLTWRMQLAPDLNAGHKYMMATDLGLSNDRACVAICHYNRIDNRVYLDNYQVWEGKPDEHINIDEIERYMVQQAERFRISKVVVDPWQMEHTIQHLRGIYPVKPFNFSTDMIYLSQMLLTVIRSGTLVIYGNGADELRKELKATIIKQTARGWKIEHMSTRHNDVTVAVGMAALAAVESFGLEPMIYS